MLRGGAPRDGHYSAATSAGKRRYKYAVAPVRALTSLTQACVWNIFQIVSAAPDPEFFDRS